MKILFVTTLGKTMDFFRSIVKELRAEGHTIDLAANHEISPVSDCFTEMGCRIYSLPLSRSPIKKGNFTAMKELRKIAGNYDLVHCHTPIAGAVARIACRKPRKKGLRVIYTAHGFHFYRGAPLKNWLVYYPIEKICAHMTDVLITINDEDYQLAKRKMKAKQVSFVPGVGVDTAFFANTAVDRDSMRASLGIPEDAFLLVSVGELNQNKNQQIVIRALGELKNPRVHYMLAGKGAAQPALEKLADALGVSSRVHFLGYRRDAALLYHIADVNMFASIREGQGLCALEGMSCGLPLICADNRGTRSYAVDGENGFVCRHDDAGAFSAAIARLMSDDALRRTMGQKALQTAAQFDTAVINRQMIDIYRPFLSGGNG